MLLYTYNTIEYNYNYITYIIIKILHKIKRYYNKITQKIFKGQEFSVFCAPDYSYTENVSKHVPENGTQA